MFCLAKNQQKQEKLREELMRIMPDSDTHLTAESLSNIPYLRGVLKESIRVYPPVSGNIRRSAKDLVIRGYRIPKGVDMVMGFYHIYKNAQYYVQPDEFIPERWIRNREVSETCPHSFKQSHPFSYLPFGYGPRFCAGKRIAEIKLEVFLSRLFRNYRVEWHHPDLKVKATMVNFLEGDLKFRLIKL